MKYITKKKMYVILGAPNDCFLWNICSEKKKLPKIFYRLRKAKNV